MASYRKFADQIGEKNIVSAYSDVLTDVHYCINLFENLETERSRTERFFDYFGVRTQIDGKNFLSNLNEFKEEIETGTKLYIDLSAKMKLLNSMPNSQESKLPLTKHSAEQTQRWGMEQQLRSQFEELLGVVADIKAPERVEPKYANIPGTKSYSAREKLYNDANVLYQTLNQKRILAILIENHSSIRELISCIDTALPNTLVSKLSTETENTSRLDSATLKDNCDTDSTKPENEQYSEHVNSPQTNEGSEQQVRRSDPVGDTQISNLDGIDVHNHALANHEYNSILEVEQYELKSEKQIREETKQGMATRAAVRNCRAFLRDNLKLSNSKTDQIIKIIQNSKVQVFH